MSYLAQSFDHMAAVSEMIAESAGGMLFIYPAVFFIIARHIIGWKKRKFRMFWHLPGLIIAATVHVYALIIIADSQENFDYFPHQAAILMPGFYYAAAGLSALVMQIVLAMLLSKKQRVFTTPPKKTASVKAAVELASGLLQNRMGLDEVRKSAIELSDGPLPYSTHDLALSVALKFFKDPEYHFSLSGASILARMDVGEWNDTVDVDRVLLRVFEDAMYEIYMPAEFCEEVGNVIQYDQDKAIKMDVGTLAWHDKETDLMWEVKTSKNINYWYVWHKTDTNDASDDDFRDLLLDMFGPDGLEEVEEVEEALNKGVEPGVPSCTKYVERMNEERYAGFDDWRLPTSQELESLLDKQGAGRLLVKKPLSDNSCVAYWSDTPTQVVNAYGLLGSDWKDTAHVPGAFIVDFEKAITAGYDTSNRLFLRCVRSS